MPAQALDNDKVSSRPTVWPSQSISLLINAASEVLGGLLDRHVRPPFYHCLPTGDRMAFSKPQAATDLAVDSCSCACRIDGVSLR